MGKDGILGKHIYMLKIALKNEWGYLPVLCAYILLTYVSPLVLIVFPKYIIDGLAGHVPIDAILKKIAFMALLYLAVNLCSQVLAVAKADLEMKLKVKLNIALSEKCMKLEYSDLEDGEVINTINSARIAVSGGLTYTQALGLSGEQGIAGYFTQLADIVSNILKGVTYLYILSRLQVWIIGVIVFGLVLVSVCSYTKKRADVDLRNYTAPFLRKNQYCNRVLRSFEAGKDIRLYHLEGYLLNKFSECNKRYIDAKNEYRRKFVLADIVSIVCNVAVVFSIYVSLVYLLAGGMVSVGEFTVISGAAISLFTCAAALITAFMNLDILSTYISDFHKIMLRGESMPCGEEGSRHLKKGNHQIVFENVSFTYSNATKAALKDINVTINSGDTISVVGANGAGKSTFVKLLTGLYRPTKGTIYIDGHPMQEYCREDLVDNMSVLFQDFKVYAMTAEENVTMSTDSHRELFEKSIDASGIKVRIEKLSQREKTPLFGFFEGREEALSGGEEQKLALARTLYKGSEILILDEPTAALDALAESEIYEHMLDQIQGKTVLFVSHRMACARFCRRVLVFDQGTIVESGAHDELIGRNGLYAKMWDAQVRYYGEADG